MSVTYFRPTAIKQTLTAAEIGSGQIIVTLIDNVASGAISDAVLFVQSYTSAGAPITITGVTFDAVTAKATITSSGFATACTVDVLAMFV